MARFFGMVALLACLAWQALLQVQSARADDTSQSRMARYFSNVPLGTQGGPGWMAAAPAGPPRLPALPPSREAAGEPAAEAPAAPPEGVPGGPMPSQAAPPTPAQDPAPKTIPPGQTPAAGEAPRPVQAPSPKQSPRALPDDPAYAPPKPKAKAKAKAKAPATPVPPEVPAPHEDEECWASDDCCARCAVPCDPCGAACADPGDWRRWLDPERNPLGIGAGGWLEFGGTVNAFSPRNRSNLPVTFNDRSNDVQMNQLYLFLERPVDVDADAWQMGGRVDLLYGTDYHYTTALGLETFGDGRPKWNSENGPVGTNYGLAMPQAYMEVFAPWANGLSVKLGHFYTIMGYESVTAPDNFFYSHAYTMQYGEPKTHTGLLAAYQLAPQWKVQAGFTRGWDTWEDNNNGLAFLGGVQWTSADERTSAALTVHTGPEADEPPPRGTFRTAYSLVLSHQLTDRLTYVLQHDYGYDPRATIATRTGNWYGINQYLLYRINPCWSAGGRFEWFHDKNGYRTGLLDGAEFYEITLGLNWTPRERLTVRPELRWDWATSDVHRYADGRRDHQILFAVDAIVTF